MDNSETMAQSNATKGISVHAGFPNPAADHRLQGLDLNRLLVEHPSSTFLFRIRGEYGTLQGIFDGDIAVVDRMRTPRDHDFVLWHDGQKFKLSRSTRITPEGTVWGTVTAIVRQYRGAHAGHQ